MLEDQLLFNAALKERNIIKRAYLLFKIGFSKSELRMLGISEIGIKKGYEQLYI